MSIKRRDFVSVAVMGGLTTILVGPSKAVGAAAHARVREPAPEQVPTPMQVWAGLKFIWDYVLPDDWKASIKASAQEAAVAAGVYIKSLVEGPADDGTASALITIRVGKDGNGQLTFVGRLEDMDGDGQPEVRYSGTAPHPQHPVIRTHMGEIFGRSRVWISNYRRRK